MDNAIKTFHFNNYPISFDFGEVSKMINASEMIKAFPNKKMNNFLRSKQTQDFIKVLESKTQKSVLLVNHGGNNQGTWMHEKLALKFAAWLAPIFELWIYDRIHELLTTGSTSIRPMTQAEALLQATQIIVEHERKIQEHDNRLDSVEDRVLQVEARTNVDQDNYFTCAGFANLVGKKVENKLAQRIGKEAAKYCRAHSYRIGKVQSAKYGLVNSYPKSVLQEIFRLMDI